MLYRISNVVLSLIVVFLGYQIYDLHALKSKVFTPVEGQYFGNPDGDIVVAEFLDYSCPQCRSVAPLIKEAVDNDGGAALLPYPVLSQNEFGSAAAYVAYAAHEFGQFMDMHDYLLRNTVPGPDTFSQDMALLLGTDEESFEEAIAAESVTNQLMHTINVLEALGINSVPSFLIRHKPSGREILFFPNPQDQSAQDFANLFAALRSSQ